MPACPAWNAAVSYLVLNIVTGLSSQIFCDVLFNPDQGVFAATSDSTCAKELMFCFVRSYSFLKLSCCLIKQNCLLYKTVEIFIYLLCSCQSSAITAYQQIKTWLYVWDVSSSQECQRISLYMIDYTASEEFPSSFVLYTFMGRSFYFILLLERFKNNDKIKVLLSQTEQGILLK